jgi:hypothetical protein
MWAMDALPASRPQSVAELITHAFFDPRGGSMREHFVVNQIKQLLVGPPLKGNARLDVNVMVSYCWADSDFVRYLMLERHVALEGCFSMHDDAEIDPTHV